MGAIVAISVLVTVFTALTRAIVLVSIPNCNVPWVLLDVAVIPPDTVTLLGFQGKLPNHVVTYDSVANGAVSNNNLPDVFAVIFNALLFVSRNINLVRESVFSSTEVRNVLADIVALKPTFTNSALIHWTKKISGHPSIHLSSC